MTTPAAAAAQAASDYAAELPAAEAVYMGPTGTGGVVTTLPCFLLGWSVRETSGAAPGHVFLITGGDANGQQITQTELAQGASDTTPLPPPGIFCPAGLYADPGSTAVHGVVWLVLVA